VATSTAEASMGGRLGAVLVAIAAAFVILGVSIVPFLTPVWIHGEQDRSGATGFVGAAADAVHWDADQIVSRLVLGGSFDITTDRLQVLLDPKEQQHMRDVRAVFDGLAILILASAAGLVVAFRRRGSAARQAFWRGVSLGARGLAVAMAVIGLLSIVAFDAAFEAFHELLFPAGSFSFDPATERLVQLFPDQFWSDTALALGVVAIILSVGVAWLASRQAARVGSTAAVSAGASTLAPRGAP
jgi:integral membrane protein (TIGR01906 family)